MSIINKLVALLKLIGVRRGTSEEIRSHHLQTNDLVRAHGDWLALLATILEREHIVSGDELARSLAEYAAVTLPDRPSEGLILGYWADRLQDAAATLRDKPSIQ